MPTPKGRKRRSNRKTKRYIVAPYMNPLFFYFPGLCVESYEYSKSFFSIILPISDSYSYSPEIGKRFEKIEYFDTNNNKFQLDLQLFASYDLIPEGVNKIVFKII